METMIRKANINDARLLARLNMAVHQPHVDAQPERYKQIAPDDPQIIAEFEERLADVSCYTFIAERDNEPLGYVQCFLRQTAPNPFVHTLLDFHVDQIAVLAHYQGQGIGKLLMEYAMQKAKDFKADVMTLGVAGFNHGAIRFYERLGFQISSYRMFVNISNE